MALSLDASLVLYCLGQGRLRGPSMKSCPREWGICCSPVVGPLDPQPPPPPPAGGRSTARRRTRGGLVQAAPGPNTRIRLDCRLEVRCMVFAISDTGCAPSWPAHAQSVIPPGPFAQAVSERLLRRLPGPRNFFNQKAAARLGPRTGPKGRNGANVVQGIGAGPASGTLLNDSMRMTRPSVSMLK